LFLSRSPNRPIRPLHRGRVETSDSGFITDREERLRRPQSRKNRRRPEPARTAAGPSPQEPPPPRARKNRRRPEPARTAAAPSRKRSPPSLLPDPTALRAKRCARPRTRRS
jgi:hypothetical protein